MYDERLYYDPISNEFFIIQLYLNHNFKFTNLPDRLYQIVTTFDGTQDFEEFIESQAQFIGHI